MSLGHSPKIELSGLVMYLDAANTKSYPGSGTTWTDLSGNGNNGTLIGGTAFSSTNSGSLVFDGTDDFVEVANSSSLNSSTNTVVCWAKSDTATWNNFGHLVSKRDVFIIHPVSSTTNVEFYYRLNGVWQAVAYTVPTITVWRMYAMSCTGSTIKAYVDGALVSSNGFTGPLNTSDTGVLTIGRDDGLSRYLDGNISQVVIYNTVLTDAQVLQIFNASRGRYGV